MVFLVRHGQTEFNVIGRYQGQTDSPLTPLGQEQARAFGRILAGLPRPPQTIWTSPMGRARATAALIAAELDARRNIPVSLATDPRLTELSFGQWDGLSKAEIKERWPGVRRGKAARAWLFDAPDGESLEAARHRLADVLRDALAVPDLLLVSHGMAGRLIRAHHAGLDFDAAMQLEARQDLIWQLAQDGSIQELRPH